MYNVDAFKNCGSVGYAFFKSPKTCLDFHLFICILEILSNLLNNYNMVKFSVSYQRRLYSSFRPNKPDESPKALIKKM